MKIHILTALTSVTFFSCLSFASVSFENLKDGHELTSPVSVKMKVTGKGVRVAGEAADDTKTGHHHLIIDGAAIPAGVPVPTDEKHLHFGKGQTETSVELTPGEHTLTLQFADGAHRSYGPEWSSTIKIKVLKKRGK